MRWFFILWVYLFGLATNALGSGMKPNPERPTNFTAEPIVIAIQGILPLPPMRPILPGSDLAMDTGIPRPPARDRQVLDDMVLAVTPPLPAPRPQAPNRQSLPALSTVPDRQPNPPSQPPENLPALAGQACYQELDRLGVQYVRLPDTRNAQGCGLSGAVEVGKFETVVLAPKGQLTCQAALATARWLKHSVRPEAQRVLGKRLVKIDHWSTYSCRSRPSGRLSEHAFGNAIDVARFYFADGSRLSVEPDWYAGGATGRFFKAIARGSCAYFSVVLDPTSDAAHQNHIHMDTGRWKSCPYD